MFESFFPRPKLFALTFAAWALFCVVTWFVAGESLHSWLSLETLFGSDGGDFWFYQYMLGCYTLFVGAWMYLSAHRWGRWSIIGSAIIVFITWFQVHLDVLINDWFGTFYDSIQKALEKPHSITAEDYYLQLLTFGKIAMVAVTVSVFTRFFVSHWVSAGAPPSTITTCRCGVGCGISKVLRNGCRKTLCVFLASWKGWA